LRIWIHDGLEAVAYTAERFGDKILVLGSSQGGILAVAPAWRIGLGGSTELP